MTEGNFLFKTRVIFREVFFVNKIHEKSETSSAKSCLHDFCASRSALL